MRTYAEIRSILAEGELASTGIRNIWAEVNLGSYWSLPIVLSR